MVKERFAGGTGGSVVVVASVVGAGAADVFWIAWCWVGGLVCLRTGGSAAVRWFCVVSCGAGPARNGAMLVVVSSSALTRSGVDRAAALK